MTVALRHRGPDDVGYFASPRASVGVRRLSIVDVAHGRQPMANEDGSVVVAFNGEVYNAGELRCDLLARGHRLQTRCDTEVLPHLYEDGGDDFVQALDGQFAIALWDARRQRLLLTRDRLGIRPLFYAPTGERLLFGSEIKSILAGLPQRPALNVEALYHYLTLKHVPAPLTIYTGVHALRPGEQAAFERGRLTRRFYWRLEGQDVAARDPDEVADRIETLLRESVRRRLIAEVPLGALLSGGLDSSLIVALAVEHAPRPLKTFTLGYVDEFAHKQADVQAARRVAELFGTAHHEHRLSYRELLSHLPAVLGAFDEPFAGVTSTYFLCKLVRRHVKVCLSGDGADELFGSYLAHRLAEPIHNVLTYGEAAVRQRPELLAPFENDPDAVLCRVHAHDWQWRAELGVFSEAEKRALLNPDLALDGLDSRALVRAVFDECPARDPQNRQQYHDCRTLLPDQVLTFNDRLSMAHSIEMRVPFLDHRLVEYVTGLPGELKIRRGVCKWILKQVARRRLPAEIVDRPKEGFVAPINAWQQRELRPAIERTLAAERLASHGLFRPQAVAGLLRRYYDGETSLQYKIWTLFCFQTWWDALGATVSSASAAPAASPPVERAPETGIGARRTCSSGVPAATAGRT